MPARTRRIAILLTLGLVAQALVAGGGAAAGGREARPGYVTGPASGPPTRIALDHVRSNPDRYGVTADDLRDLVVTDAYPSAHTGVTHVYLGQRLHGLDVLGSSMAVSVAPDGSIIHVGARLVRELSRASGRPALGPARAAARAAGALGLSPTAPFRLLEAPRGPARATRLSRSGVSLSPIPARLAYQPVENGIRLAWNLEIEEVSQEHWWNASVDAETGALLAKTDYVDHDTAEDTAAAVGRAGGRVALPVAPPDPVADGSSYRVYQLPLESPNDGPRTLVENPADALASPFGWHDTDGAPGAEHTTTQGNNVQAYLDTTNLGMGTPVTEADGGENLDFDFAYDPSLPPTAYKDAAVTNLFYWNNIIHDAFYRYGFDEASGNFQVNNYGRGGAGNDSVRAEAQDGSGVNNANFATPTDGSRPRMQMYVWISTLTQNRQLIDGDFDAGVIIHEYGHGISNRLTGGPNTGGCLSNQEQMGEGWSDWLAIALTALESESGPQRRGMGTFVLGQPNRQGPGIRPRPYSTNLSVNNATYDTIKTAAVPHGVGYVWATILWEVFWNLVDKHGFNPNPYEDWTTGGNNLAIQLVMDGMKFQPCRPGFVDGRDAILAADLALTGGQNQCAVWRGFAKRGLGYSADQGSSTNRGDGTQAFDTHPDCRAGATVTPGAVSGTAAAGGSTSVPIAVGNRAQPDGSDLTWEIRESPGGCSSFASVSWLSTSPAAGTTAAAGVTDVSVTLDASELLPGTHTAALCLVSDDEQTPVVEVPVSFAVG